MDNKCPYCGAETRPDDNFCLNCGNRLPSVAPSQQPQPASNDATLAAGDDWAASVPHAFSDNAWSESSSPTIANSGEDVSSSYHTEAAAPTVQATLDKIEHPSRFILRAESGEVLQEYLLDKFEIAIGRAPNSDILLSKDKLTSRRHATIHYENGRYVLYDERSANGTFVNGQQLDEMKPYVLQEGDHVGIGEHEMVFSTNGSATSAVEDLPTIAVPPLEGTYRTREDERMTVLPTDDFNTRDSMDVEPLDQPAVQEEPVSNLPVASASSSLAESALPAIPVIPPTPASVATFVTAPPANTSEENTNLAHFTDLSMPVLPDMTPLVAALSTLDGQVMSLQEQINATQESMRTHEAEIARTTIQLRTGLRRVSDRMDSTIADVARSREALSWAKLLQLMDDVMNNPRDIEYVTELARRARELNKVFQIHQNVLNTMAECNSLLRSMLGEDK